MPNRLLRIVRRPTFLMGVCEYCNAEFRSHLVNQEVADWELKVLFSRHKCEPGGPNGAETKRSPHLIDYQGVLRCSVCKMPFPLDTRPSVEEVFAKHVAKAHRLAQMTEDVNQAAVRVVQQATEKNSGSA